MSVYSSLTTMMLTPRFLLPPHEAHRLATLHTYDILNSLQEPLFSKLVELTATLFNVPISLIALVDADEVEYKATYGLPQLRSQPRVEAICSMPVKYQQAVVYTDLALDNSLTLEAASAAQAKGLRFYAGAPMRMPTRDCIGTLCLIDRQPRSFSPPEQRVLEQFAHVVARLIAVRRHCLSSRLRGEEYWGVVSGELGQEIQGLLALVQYLVGYSGLHTPVPANILESVDQRLTAFCWRLTDYYRGPL